MVASRSLSALWRGTCGSSPLGGNRLEVGPWTGTTAQPGVEPIRTAAQLHPGTDNTQRGRVPSGTERHVTRHPVGMGDDVGNMNRLREFRVDAGLDQVDVPEKLTELAGEELGIDANSVSRHERGTVLPSRRYRRLYARLYGVSEVVLWPRNEVVHAPTGDAELEALELVRRIEASDLSTTTLDQLELAFDDMACSYVRTTNEELLPNVRTHLRYVSNLVDARSTLAQKRRLLVVGGWFSLLSATLHVDIDLRTAKAARDTAFNLGGHAGHPELQAWAFEVDAWSALMHNDYRKAVEFSKAGSDLAPHGSSVAVQLAAQEARAWARLKDGPNALSALRRTAHELSQLPVPTRPEHHFAYDERKFEWYTGTVLAWLGDATDAEATARNVVRRYENEDHYPRRLVASWLDLALVVAKESPDEAAHLAKLALSSNWLLPSSTWRVGELHGVLMRRDPKLSETRELHDRWLSFLRSRNQNGTSYQF